MSIVAVDIGNTATKIAARSKGGGLCRATVFPTGSEPDLFAYMATLPADDHQWRVSRVHQGAVEQLQRGVASQRPADHLRVIRHNDLPLDFAVPNPAGVGMDRLCAAAAAAQLNPNSTSLVIDAGTAVTVDLVDANATFLGGAIFPGVRLQSGSLAQGTDGLMEIASDPTETPVAIGTSTEHAIASGVYWGIVGGIVELARQFQLDHAVGQVFLTGGDGPWLLKSLPFEVDHQPQLVLQGLLLATP